MYKIATFVNVECVDRVKDAMFESGGGRIGAYDRCCFVTKGIGQFRPLKGSTPYIGELNKDEFVEEVRIEMVASEENVKAVLKAMKLAHPYETPAYDVVKLEEL